jgi:UDP-glucose 4-epimerase
MGITLDAPVEVRPRGEDDAFTILLDPSATNRDFDWRTTVPLESGVAQAIAYYKAFGITDTYTHLKMDTLRA